MLRLLRMAIASYEVNHILKEKQMEVQNTIYRKINRGRGSTILHSLLASALSIPFRLVICHGKNQHKKYFCKKSGEVENNFSTQ